MGNRTGRVAGTAAVWMIASCGGAETQHTGYVLLEKEPGTNQATVQVGQWRGSPAMPLALDPTEHITVRGPGGPTSVQLLPGVLLRLRASGATERLRIGVDVAPDRLIVKGTAEAVRELATSVDARATQREDGAWVVEGPDLYERGSFMAVPRGIDSVAPAFIGVTSRTVVQDVPAQTSISLSATGIPLAPVGARTPGQRMAMLVGLYQDGGRWLLLDAGGHYSWRTGCGIEQTGTFRLDGESVSLTPTDGPESRFRLRADETLVDESGTTLTPFDGVSP